ncbi:hypothetical protein ACFOYW_04640 [Gryllotalpicola reticulitermitis]|uniref:Uncharacterized protein n=1 Tax=Gryllotalpicola reticulitermitis TaxID=1184153 RepID=A0ABV8Q5E1_9MICO
MASLLATRHAEVVLTPANYDSRSVEWGEPWMYESPAYWIARAKDMAFAEQRDDLYCLGDSLAEEVVACLLGGFGVTYELNVAAFHAVRGAGLISAEVSPDPTEVLD